MLQAGHILIISHHSAASLISGHFISWYLPVACFSRLLASCFHSFHITPITEACQAKLNEAELTIGKLVMLGLVPPEMLPQTSQRAASSHSQSTQPAPPPPPPPPPPPQPQNQVTTLVMTGAACSFEDATLLSASTTGSELAYLYGFEVPPMLFKVEQEKKRIWMRFEHREDMVAVLNVLQEKRLDLNVVTPLADLQTAPTLCSRFSCELISFRIERSILFYFISCAPAISLRNTIHFHPICGACMTEAVAERDLQRPTGPVLGDDVPSKTLFLGGIIDTRLCHDDSWIRQYFPESLAYLSFGGFHFIVMALHFDFLALHISLRRHIYNFSAFLSMARSAQSVHFF